MRCPGCNFETEFDTCPNCRLNLAACKKAIAISDRYYNSALALAKEDDLSAAADLLTKSLKFNKYNIDSRNLLGLVYGACGRLGEALGHWIISNNYKQTDNIATDYIESIKNDYRSYEKMNESLKLYNKALSSLEMNNDDMAIIQLKRSVDINAAFVQGFNLLAACYAKQGKNAKAMTALKRALEVDSGNKDSIRYMQALNSETTYTKSEDKHKNSSSSSKKVLQMPPSKYNPKYDKSIGSSIRFGFSHIVALVIGAMIIFAVYNFYVMAPKLDEKDREVATVKDEMTVAAALHTTELEERDNRIKAKDDEINSLKSQISELNSQLDVKDRIQKLNYSMALLQDEKYEEALQYSASIGLENIPAEYAAIPAEIIAIAYPILEKENYDQGLAEYNKRNYAEAQVFFEKAIPYAHETSAISDDCLYYLGRIADFNGDKQLARQYFERLMENYPGSNLYETTRGRLNALGN